MWREEGSDNADFQSDSFDSLVQFPETLQDY